MYIYFCKSLNCSAVTPLVFFSLNSPSFPIYAGTSAEFPFCKFLSCSFTTFTSAKIRPFILKFALILSSISSCSSLLSDFIICSNMLKYKTPAGIKSSSLHAASKYVSNWICSPAYTSFKSIFLADDL